MCCKSRTHILSFVLSFALSHLCSLSLFLCFFFIYVAFVAGTTLQNCTEVLKRESDTSAAKSIPNVNIYEKEINYLWLHNGSLNKCVCNLKRMWVKLLRSVFCYLLQFIVDSGKRNTNITFSWVEGESRRQQGRSAARRVLPAVAAAICMSRRPCTR